MCKNCVKKVTQLCVRFWTFSAMFRICSEFSVMFRICSEFSAMFRICSEFSAMFRICSEFSVIFRICSEFSAIFRICLEFSAMFRIFSEFWVIFRIFRHFSEFLAQKLVYSESLDFVVFDAEENFLFRSNVQWIHLGLSCNGLFGTKADQSII